MINTVQLDNTSFTSHDDNFCCCCDKNIKDLLSQQL